MIPCVTHYIPSIHTKDSHGAFIANVFIHERYSLNDGLLRKGRFNQVYLLQNKTSIQ